MLLQAMDIPIINAEDAESVKGILIYLVGLLTVLLIAVVTYLISLNNKRFEEKKQIIINLDLLISEKNRAIQDIQDKLDKENEYVKDLGQKTLSVVSDSTVVLNATSKALDKMGVDIPIIRTTTQTSNDTLKELNAKVTDHLINKNR